MQVSRIPVAVAVVLVSLVGVGTALAGAPQKGTTVTTVTSDTITTIRLVGGNIIESDAYTATLTGAFSGTSTFTSTGVIHPDGTGVFHGSGTFTGSVAGCGAVSASFATEFRANPDGTITGTDWSVGGSAVTWITSISGSTVSPVFVDQVKYVC